MKASRKQTKQQPQQLNIRVERALYQTLEAVASQDRSSIPQAAKHLLEDGLRQRLSQRTATDDVSAEQIAALAAAGTGFDWLTDEPELYDNDGQPV